MYGNMGGYSDAVGAALGEGASQSGADAHDSSNMGEYGFGDSPISYSDNINFNSIADALASALGLGKPAKQTDTFPAGQSMAPKTSNPFSLSSFVPGNMAATMMAMITNPDPMQDVMSVPNYNAFTDNLGYDPGLAQASGTLSGVPQYSHEPMDPLAAYGYGEMMQNVPMVGSGVHQGLASQIDNIGGQNLHRGIGFQANEKNYAGFGGNPLGPAFADPSPYVRKPRNIAQMIGV